MANLKRIEKYLRNCLTGGHGPAPTEDDYEYIRQMEIILWGGNKGWDNAMYKLAFNYLKAQETPDECGSPQNDRRNGT